VVVIRCMITYIKYNQLNDSLNSAEHEDI